MDEARATYCFCGCGRRITSPWLVVLNTNGWDLSEELSQWTKLELVLPQLVEGSLQNNIQSGHEVWGVLASAVHAEERLDRSDQARIVAWKKHAKKDRRKLSRKMKREGFPNPFDLPDISAQELNAWITEGTPPEWASETSDTRAPEGELSERLADVALYKLPDDQGGGVGVLVDVVAVESEIEQRADEVSREYAERMLAGDESVPDPETGDLGTEVIVKAAFNNTDHWVKEGAEDMRGDDDPRYSLMRVDLATGRIGGGHSGFDHDAALPQSEPRLDQAESTPPTSESEEPEVFPSGAVKCKRCGAGFSNREGYNRHACRP